MPMERGSMDHTPSGRGPAAESHRTPLSPRGALLLAAWFGLVSGYLDLGGILLKRDVLHASVYYKQGWFFPWTVPLADLAILMVPGLLVAGLNRLRPGWVSVRTAAWVLATLGL